MDTSKGSCFQWLKVEFLEQVLRTVEKDDTIKITYRNVEDAAKGEHYASTMFRVAINISRQSAISENKSVIIKVVPKKIFGEIISESTAFPREIKMYSEILPRMQELMEKIIPAVLESFGARYYYSENVMPYVLMVEDLCVSRFKMANRINGLDLSHSILAMKTLGRFHASSFLLYEESPQLFETFRKSIFLETKAMADFILNFSTNQIRNVIKVVENWDDAGKRFAEKLRRHLEIINDDFVSAYTTNPNDFNVLIHGDLWLNNMMFRYDDVTGDVKDIKFVDYQMCTIASPVIDLQYFINTSVTDEVRQYHTEKLFKTYHTELVDTLSLLGHQEKTISYENLLEAYERKSSVGFLWALIVLPLVMVDKAAGHDLESIATADSNNVDGSSISNECENVLKRLLPSFEKRGLL